MRTKSLTKLTDNELVRRLERLCITEREILVTVLRYLIEVERRELYLARGYGSLHEFCTGHLKYSSSAAGRRITAARCMKRCPRVVSMLLREEINLSVLSLVAGILSPENYRDILSRMRGRLYRDVERLVARHRPSSEVRDRVKPVYIRTELKVAPGSGGDADGDAPGIGNSAICDKSCSGTVSGDLEGGAISLGGGGENSTPDVGSSACLKSTSYGDIFASGVESGSDRGDAGSLGVGGGDQQRTCIVLEQKYKLEFAVDPDFMEKLERLRALLSTKSPKGLDFETLFTIVLDDYLDRHSPEGKMKRRAKRKAKAINSKETVRKSQMSESPRKEPGSGGERSREKAGSKSRAASRMGESSSRKPRAKNKNISNSKKSRYIPQSVRDEVFERDGGRCTYVGTGGKRCVKRENLQVDHIVPFARGGVNTADNLRLLCNRHNMLLAERAYGKERMKQFRQKE